MNHALMVKYGRIPFVLHGADHTGMDCQGFVRLYYLDTRQLQLPDAVFQWRHYFRNLKPTEQMQEGDLLVMAYNNDWQIADHMAVAISDTEVMHCAATYGGVVCQPKERLHGILQIMRLR